MNYTSKLAEEVHKIAVEKGFWTPQSNSDEKFALIITELCESIEAHRKGKFAKQEDYKNAIDSYSENFESAFQAYIKDTVEDELADTVIRCLDYIYRYKKEYFAIAEVNLVWANNFAENILKIIRENILYDVEYIISYISSLSKKYEIDLEWHINEKMRYNQTREHKHGKNY